MFAEAASRWLARRGIHYAWAMMVVGFLVMLVSSSALGLPGAFLRPLSHEFGWTTGQISSAIAIRFALFGLIGPFAAILIERHGLRRIACTALLLIAAGMLLATRMTALWQLFILWGLVLGVGSGLTALVLAATLANRWFERRRHGGRIFGSLCGPCARSRIAAPSGCSRARSSSVD